MKKAILFSLVAAIGIYSSCSKDKPTSPKGDEYRLVASETIGPGGGAIGDEDFTLTVLPGAFGADAQLKLYVSNEDQPFEENQSTSTYRLEGVPDDYARPLEVRLRYSGAPSDSAHLAVGEEGIAYGSGEPMTAYSIYPAADSAGYLVSYLPVPEGGRSFRRQGSFARDLEIGSQGYIWVVTLGLRDYRSHMSSTGHFLTWYPADRTLLIDDLEAYLEAAYDTCLAMGFRYHSQKYWPQDVLVFPEGVMNFSPYADFVAFRSETKGCFENLVFNRENFDDWNLPQIRMAAGREFMDMVLFTYDPTYPDISPYAIPHQEWLDCAVERWSEEKFTDSPGHVPADFRSCEMEPFEGMQAEEDIHAVEHHGRGMAAVVKYLTAPDRFGDRVLAPIYERIANREEPAKAIIEHIDEYPNIWWPEFFRRYVGGQIYEVEASVFTHGLSISGSFQTSRDTADTFHGSYQDLSAKLYLIELDNPNLASAAELVLRASSPDINDDNLQLIVFTLKDGQLEFFAQAQEVTVGNVKGLTQDGYDLLVVVINSAFHEPSFTEDSDIDLEVKFKRAQLNRCWIYVGVTAHWQNSDEDSWQEFSYQQWSAQGEFAGNVFTGTPVPEVHGSNCTGTVTVVVDPGQQRINSFSADYLTMATQGNMWWISRISGGNLPYTGTLDWVSLVGDEYKCEELSTSGCVDVVEYKNEQTDGWWLGYDTFHCDQDSRVEIRLYAAP